MPEQLFAYTPPSLLRKAQLVIVIFEHPSRSIPSPPYPDGPKMQLLMVTFEQPLSVRQVEELLIRNPVMLKPLVAVLLAFG